MMTDDTRLAYLRRNEYIDAVKRSSFQDCSDRKSSSLPTVNLLFKYIPYSLRFLTGSALVGVLVALFLLSANPASAITLAFKYKKGDEFTYRNQSSTGTGTQTSEAMPSYKMTVTMWTACQITDIKPGPVFMMDVRMTRVKLAGDVMGKPFEYDSADGKPSTADRADAQKNVDKAEQEKKSTSEGHEELDAMWEEFQDGEDDSGTEEGPNFAEGIGRQMEETLGKGFLMEIDDVGRTVTKQGTAGRMFANVNGSMSLPVLPPDKKDVKPGDTWQHDIPMDDIPFPQKIDGQSTLKAIETFNGRQCAVIETTFKFGEESGADPKKKPPQKTEKKGGEADEEWNEWTEGTESSPYDSQSPPTMNITGTGRYMTYFAIDEGLLVRQEGTIDAKMETMGQAVAITLSTTSELEPPQAGDKK